jgi:hypothetical protein
LRILLNPVVDFPLENLILAESTQFRSSQLTRSGGTLAATFRKIPNNYTKMQINKILYKLSLLVGIFILTSGIVLKLTENSSSGYLFRKNGDIKFQTIDGNGAVILGIIILAFTLWMYKSYKKEEIEIEKRKSIERNEIALKKRNKGNR